MAFVTGCVRKQQRRDQSGTFPLVRLRPVVLRAEPRRLGAVLANVVPARAPRHTAPSDGHRTGDGAGLWAVSPLGGDPLAQKGNHGFGDADWVFEEWPVAEPLE
jgi:hypothetical protein